MKRCRRSWYLTADKPLSRKAKAIFDNLGANGDHVYVPTLDLAELMLLEEKGRTTASYDAVVQHLEETDRCTIIPITVEVVEAAKQVEGAAEPFDRLIAATAIYLEGKLIMRDAVPASLTNVQAVW